MDTIDDPSVPRFVPRLVQDDYPPAPRPEPKTELQRKVREQLIRRGLKKP